MNREFRIVIFIALAWLVGLVHFVFVSRWRTVVIKDENGKFQEEKTGNIFIDCTDDPLQWNCNNDWSKILFNLDGSFSVLEILMKMSYYLVLVGFGSGFSGLAFVYLTDIFYETGVVCG